MENAEPPLRVSLVADVGCRSQSSSLRPNQSAPPFLGWVGLDAMGVLCLEPASPLRSVLSSAKNLLQDREEGSMAGQVTRPNSPLSLWPRPPLLGGDCELHTEKRRSRGRPGAARGQPQAPRTGQWSWALLVEHRQTRTPRMPPHQGQVRLRHTGPNDRHGHMCPEKNRLDRVVSSSAVCYLFLYSAIACVPYCSVAAASKGSAHAGNGKTRRRVCTVIQRKRGRCG